MLIQCVKHSLQENVGEYLVDDEKKANGAVVLDVGHITFLVEELGTRRSDEEVGEDRDGGLCTVLQDAFCDVVLPRGLVPFDGRPFFR